MYPRPHIHIIQFPLRESFNIFHIHAKGTYINDVRFYGGRGGGVGSSKIGEGG